MLYQRNAPSIHGILVAEARAADVDDLLQEVFARALRSLGALKEPARFAPWLHAIARNLARDALRRRGHSAARAAHDQGAVGQQAVASEHDATSAVLAVVRELPPAYRETLVLRLVEGLAGPEIARRTGLTHGSVRVNLCRGMKLLRERLEARGWTP